MADHTITGKASASTLFLVKILNFNFYKVPGTLERTQQCFGNTNITIVILINLLYASCQ